jgi:hypothetical protein
VNARALLLAALFVGAALVYAAPRATAWWSERGSYDLLLTVKPGDKYRFKVHVDYQEPGEKPITGWVLQEIEVREMIPGAAKNEPQRFIYDQRLIAMEVQGKDRTEELLDRTERKAGWNTFNVKSKRAGGQQWIPFKPTKEKEFNAVLNFAAATFGSFPYERVKVGEKWVGMCMVANQCVGGEYQMLEADSRTAKLKVTEPGVLASKMKQDLLMTIDLSHGFPTEAEYTIFMTKSGATVHVKQEMVQA